MIKDVQVKGGYIIHMGSVEGTIRVGDKVNLLIDTVSSLMLTTVNTITLHHSFSLNFVVHYNLIKQKMISSKCFLFL